MANREFVESGIKFVFDEELVFLLEKQPFYVKMQNVRACDFITLQKREAGSRLLLIEAKSSAPKQEEPLEKYLQEVYEKFWHSLLLYIGALYYRFSETPENIPKEISNKDNLGRKIACVLVVRQHKREWLPLLQEALRKRTKPLLTAFGLQDVFVTNEAGAAKHQLARSNQL